uniref:uncharacterized protein LOC117708333 n=1 Tax=Arvicanthis niloticus TaxID=61156 RepID=UPI001486DA87|nr:uncharacterized protein LOC117708333 [Arvicanthis niloticus]
MSLRTWNLPHPYIICNLRSPRSREVKIARLSGRSVLCRVEGQDQEGRTCGEPESWATECPSCGFGRDTFSPVSCVMTQEIHPRRWFQDSPGKRGKHGSVQADMVLEEPRVIQLHQKHKDIESIFVHRQNRKCCDSRKLSNSLDVLLIFGLPISTI